MQGQTTGCFVKLFRLTVAQFDPVTFIDATRQVGLLHKRDSLATRLVRPSIRKKADDWGLIYLAA